MKTLVKADKPWDIVRGAYDLSLTPEALGRLKEIKEIQEYAIEQAEVASGITITDDASDARAADVTVNLTKARKALEELQKYFTTPLEQSKKSIIAVMKKLGADSLAQEERLRREAGEWFMKKENERRDKEAQRLANEEATRNRAARLGRSAPKFITPPPTETQRSVSTENGARGISLYWGFDIIDMSQVPDQYVVREINKKAVDAAIESGVREIAGLKISERPRSVVR